MPIKKNYHMHTVLCGHAVGTIEDNINMAIKLGYEKIGFSEHAPLPMEAFKDPYDNKRLYASENITMDIMQKDYINVLERHRSNQIDIMIGLESEYLPSYHSFYEALREKVEYMILGVHFFEMNGKLIDTYAEINKDTIYGYAEAVKKALDTKLFNVLAHPDLYLFDGIEFDDDAKKVADLIIDAAIKNNVLVEINCNGKGKYPRDDFYEYIKDKGATFIIGVDSHSPDRLEGAHIESSISLAKKYNLKLTDEVK